MQRRILTALAARPGGDTIRNHRDYSFTLAAGIHDMRQVSQELARTNGGISHCDFVSGSWSASFTRALTSLVSQGYIEVLSLVPLADDELGIATQLSDGLYLPNANRSQHRFVRLLPETGKTLTLKRSKTDPRPPQANASTPPRARQQLRGGG
jgi:hypothetical protein